jgi:cellulose synthase (UDP-forming)
MYNIALLTLRWAHTSLFCMSRAQKLYAFAVMLLLAVYLVWLATDIVGWLGLVLLVAELIFAGSLALFLRNHWTQRQVRRPSNGAEGLLDVFLPVVNEPLDLFEQTVAAACAIEYGPKKVYILDDGGRPEVAEIARQYGAKYLARGTSEHYKAGNMNYALACSYGDFILALDADQVVSPKIAKHLLGHFAADSQLAFVTTRQQFALPKGDFNHETLFYDHMQAGKNADNAAISTGSGVIYRRSAVESIGGFQTWNIVEDFYTSYVLHQHGFRSLYMNRAYTTGTAPVDLPMIYKQRGTWALDSMRMFFKRNPLLVRGLTWRQRLHYFESGVGYVVPAVVIPGIFLLVAVSSLLNVPLFRHPEAYAVLRTASMAGVLGLFYWMGNRNLVSMRFWIGLFPVYFKALVLALLPGKAKYKVTSKTVEAEERSTELVVPHLLLLVANVDALVWVQLHAPNLAQELSQLVWTGVMAYWFAPVVAKAWLLDPLLRAQRQPRTVRSFWTALDATLQTELRLAR